jgi:hypothetical protein
MTIFDTSPPLSANGYAHPHPALTPPHLTPQNLTSLPTSTTAPAGGQAGKTQPTTDTPRHSPLPVTEQWGPHPTTQ